MMTHTAIAKRFKAGKSIHDIAYALWAADLKNRGPRLPELYVYVETVIRQVMKRQHAKHDGRR